jgi:copper(I)-binding protein
MFTRIFMLPIIIFLLVACDQNQTSQEAPHETQQMSNTGTSEIGGVSGAYMVVSNMSASDVTLLSLNAEGVGMAQIHQSILEDNIMRMEHMANGLLIPAGEAVELRPGTYHVMLMQLEKDLVEGDTVRLTLEFDDGTSIALDAPIAFVSPEDSLSVENDGITVTQAWVRPTLRAEDNTQDSEITEAASGD